jgi:hypothetical protein
VCCQYIEAVTSAQQSVYSMWFQAILHPGHGKENKILPSPFIGGESLLIVPCTQAVKEEIC